MKKGQKILFLSGQDVLIKECNIILSQPKIKDIALFGEDDFLIATQLLGKTGEFTKKIREGNSVLFDMTDFQLLLILVLQQEDFKESMQKFFELCFPAYTIDITSTAINFSIEEKVVGQVQAFNFQAMQEVIKDLFIPVLENQEKPIEYNPANDKAKQIAEKIKIGRAKVAKLNMTEEDEYASLFARFISTISVGLAMDINILYNYTPYQLYDTFNRYMLKIKNDFYTKVSTTPLMDVSKMEQPEDWMKNI